MRYFNSAIFSIAFIIFSGLTVFSQETQVQVIDEVVAQVNEDVITLSQIKRELKGAADSLVQEGKTREEAENMVTSRKGELIANMINEQLIAQKGKEYGIDSEIEARVNQQFLAKMKELNLTTLEQLYEAMRQSGVEPDQIRNLYREQMLRDMVFEREVDGKIYWALSSRELKDYYEKNKAKFTKPETFTLSEIFLGFAGRDEAAVREKAKKIMTELRGGADFEKLVVENSDNPDNAKNKGKLGVYSAEQIAKIGPQFAKALANPKKGAYIDPIEVDEGIHILRVDDYQKPTSESFFDERAVRQSLAYERIPEGRKKFMTDLRRNAYIKINEDLRPIVSPILFADDRKTEKAEK